MFTIKEYQANAIAAAEQSCGCETWSPDLSWCD